MPLVMKYSDTNPYGRTDYLVIVNSIVPYEAKKRLREQ